MLPVLTEINLPYLGGVSLHAYGVFIFLGFILGIAVFHRFQKDLNLSSKHFWEIALGCSIGGILGSRLFYCFEHATEITLIQIFRIFEGGLVFYGGVLGALMVLNVYCHKEKLGFLAISDRLALALPLGTIIGRVGNFFHGGVYGFPSDHPFAVIYPSYSPANQDPLLQGQALVPISLIYAFVNGLIFISLLLMRGRFTQAGRLSALYLMVYGVFRLLADYFRADLPRMNLLGGITFYQIVGFLFMMAGIMLWQSLAKAKSHT